MSLYYSDWNSTEKMYLCSSSDSIEIVPDFIVIASKSQANSHEQKVSFIKRKEDIKLFEMKKINAFENSIVDV